MLPEVRTARIIDAIKLHRATKLNCCGAAEMLGLSERHFRRLRDADGAEGIIDGRRGRASGRRAPVDEIAWVIEEFRTRCFGVTAQHFHAAILRRPMSDGSAFKRSCTWTKGVLQSRGLVTKASKRSVHRRERVRRPLFGMMLFQDGSRHTRMPQGPELDPIVIMDDATSRILSIFLVEEEGAASTFRGLEEVIAQHGLSSSFYTDRGSHASVTAQAGGRVDRLHPTRVGRALKRLGIQHVASCSPEGRGRMERVWGTLRKRLPPLLRIEAPADIAAADRWPADVYRDQHNARFAVKAAEHGSAFVPFVGDLDATLCIGEERVVGHDDTVRYGRRVLQVPEQNHRRHFVRAKVRVHEDPVGTLAIFHGPRRLAPCTADGTLHDPDAVTRSAASARSTAGACGRPGQVRWLRLSAQGEALR